MCIMFLAQVVEPCLAVLQRASRSLGSRLYTFSRTSPLLFRTLLGAHHFDKRFYRLFKWAKIKNKRIVL